MVLHPQLGPDERQASVFFRIGKNDFRRPPVVRVERVEVVLLHRRSALIQRAVGL
jgi:hypothetical protein